MLPPLPRFIPPLGPPKLSSRDRVLAQWRGVDLSSEIRARKEKTRAAGDVLPKVFTALRFDNRRADAEIVKVWNTLLDPAITAHAQPTGWKKGTLFVTVDSNAWLAELVRFKKPEILERLRHSFGSEFVKKIAFRVG